MDNVSSGGTDLLSDGVLSVAEAVKFTGLSRSELYLQMAGGKLAYTSIGRRRLIPKRSLVALLGEQLRPAAAGAAR